VTLEIDAANDFAYTNSYISGGTTGVKITGGSAIRIIGNSIFNLQLHGIQVTGGDSILIDGNDIADVSQAVTNTSDGINFTSVATNARIVNNRIGNQIFPAFGNQQRNGITIPTGASDQYVIANNVITNFGTTDISDGGTGTNKIVAKPGIIQTATYQVFTTGWTLPASIGNDSTGGVAFTTNGGKVWDILNSGGLVTPAGAPVDFAEGAAPGGVGGFSVVYADSTAHRLKMNNNNTGASLIVGVDAATSQKTETAADTNVLTFTPPALAGTYRINFALSLSAANAATLGWTVTWTDSNGNAQTPTNLALSQSGTAAPALTFTTSSAGNYYGTAVVDVNSAAVAIVVKLTFSGTSFAGKASATIERLI
jgi:hypothetical protein